MDLKKVHTNPMNNEIRRICVNGTWLVLEQEKLI